MVLDSIPWKDELQKLIDDLTSTTLPFKYDEDCEDDEDSRRGFLIERALMYSAFVARLLLDARKTTDSLNGCNLSIGVIPNTLENPEYIQPMFRRFPECDYYDYESESMRSVSCRHVLNQIIHSFVIPTYEVDESGSVTGFFVSSDKDANSQLYHIKLDSWIKYLRTIVDDDITSMHTYFDREKRKWIETRC